MGSKKLYLRVENYIYKSTHIKEADDESKEIENKKEIWIKFTDL